MIPLKQSSVVLKAPPGEARSRIGESDRSVITQVLSCQRNRVGSAQSRCCKTATAFNKSPKKERLDIGGRGRYSLVRYYHNVNYAAPLPSAIKTLQHKHIRNTRFDRVREDQYGRHRCYFCSGR